MKYFLHIAYKGTHYRGWQRQVGVSTLQQVMEEALAQMLGHSLAVLGCGRTDAKVHASQYFLQFETQQPASKSWVFVLNQILPADVRVLGYFPVAASANVQLDARSRTYRYYFHTKQNPFLANLSTFYDLQHWDIPTVRKALEGLVGTHDFRAFCKTPDRHHHTQVALEKAQLFVNQEQTQFCVEITANRFLKGMMRALVHALIELGQGKTTLDHFLQRLSTAQNYPQIQLAYPQGLYLSCVQYDYLDIPPQPTSVNF